MILPREPAKGDNILIWAANVQRLLRDFDRRINSILPSRRVASIPGASAASSTMQPFQLLVSDDGATPSPSPMIRVIPSTLAGGSSVDLGFSTGDDPPYLLTPSEGVLIGGISWNVTTGAIESRWLEIQTTFPATETVPDGTDYVELGTVHWDSLGEVWTVTNSRYGPIAAKVCRNWFAAEAPFFSATWL